jgi:hypothetical protein
MPDLLITRALPNPAGKDRTPAHLVTNDQLNGEWIEFANMADHDLVIDGVRISDYTFNNYCHTTGERQLTTFTGSMPCGSSIRLHTGYGEPWNEGVIRHLYLNHDNFVWNNRCGDTATLRVQSPGEIDHATYDPHPPEGAILKRVPGTHRLALIAASGTGTYGR